MNEMNKKPEVQNPVTEIPAVKPIEVGTTSPINPQASVNAPAKDSVKESVKESVRDFVNEGNPSTSTPATETATAKK